MNNINGIITRAALASCTCPLTSCTTHDDTQNSNSCNLVFPVGYGEIFHCVQNNLH